MPSYDPPGTAYTGTPSQGAKALRAACMDHFGVGDLGIVRDRDRCPPSGPKSIHCEARAWDAKVAAPSAVGDALANWAAAHMDELGIQEVIWNRRAAAYWNGYKWGPYSGASAHTDHVHIGLTKNAAATLTEARVRAALGTGDNDMTPEEHDALVRIDARSGNIEGAVARIDPEVMDALKRIEDKLAAGGSGGGKTDAQVEAAVRKVLKEGTGGTP